MTGDKILHPWIYYLSKETLKMHWLLIKIGKLFWIIWLGLISPHEPFKNREFSLAVAEGEVWDLKNKGDSCTIAGSEDGATMC